MSAWSWTTTSGSKSCDCPTHDDDDDDDESSDSDKESSKKKDSAQKRLKALEDRLDATVQCAESMLQRISLLEVEATAVHAKLRGSVGLLYEMVKASDREIRYHISQHKFATESTAAGKPVKPSFWQATEKTPEEQARDFVNAEGSGVNIVASITCVKNYTTVQKPDK